MQRSQIRLKIEAWSHQLKRSEIHGRETLDDSLFATGLDEIARVFDTPGYCLDQDKNFWVPVVVNQRLLDIAIAEIEHRTQDCDGCVSRQFSDFMIEVMHNVSHQIADSKQRPAYGFGVASSKEGSWLK